MAIGLAAAAFGAVASLAAGTQPQPAPALAACGPGVYGTDVASLDPAWSPDGHEIAVSAGIPGFNSGIWMVRPDGTQPRLVTSGVAQALFHPAWSPDGSLLAFDTALRDEVYVVRPDGTGLRLVGHGEYPAFAPDGNRLAVIEPSPDHPDQPALLQVIGLDGRTPATLDYLADSFSGVSWSPDGTTIAYGRYDVDAPPSEAAFSRLTLVAADGGSPRMLGGRVIHGWDPEWSPDGTRIAYTALWGDNDGREVHVVRPDGSRDGPLTNDLYWGRDLYGRSTSAPTWSPDGRHVLFEAWPVYHSRATSRDKVGQGLWSVGADGLGEHRLAPGCLFGTGGADVLHGTRAADRIHALEGDDRVDVRGGGRDIVDCGSGIDRVVADRRDLVARNCERVVRR